MNLYEPNRGRASQQPLARREHACSSAIRCRGAEHRLRGIAISCPSQHRASEARDFFDSRGKTRRDLAGSNLGVATDTLRIPMAESSLTRDCARRGGVRNPIGISVGICSSRSNPAVVGHLWPGLKVLKALSA